MKKYQWIVVVTLLALAGCLAALDGGVLGVAVGVAGGMVCFGLLIISFVKLDWFDFPEGSVLEALALHIQKPIMQTPVHLEQPLSSTVRLEMSTHTAA